MCCFSGPVHTVGDTRIFVRADRNAPERQVLVYMMSYEAAGELAMVLPLPVPPQPPEDAVRFVSLEGYPEFFDHLDKPFQPYVDPEFLGSDDREPRPPPRLVVHDVGDFEASFVPRVADFDRLDPRYRMPAGTWERLPAYANYGFAVFKLKAAVAGRRVHPMAFTFPRCDPDTLFFPTVHIHDGVVRGAAEFDHSLYVQADSSRFLGSIRMAHKTRFWDKSGPARLFMDISRLDPALIDPDGACALLRVEGRFENKDITLGAGAGFPQPLPGREARCIELGDPPASFLRLDEYRLEALGQGAKWVVLKRDLRRACRTEAEVEEALASHEWARVYSTGIPLVEQGLGLSRAHWEAGDRE